MEIYFASEQLRKLCIEEREMRRRLGEPCSRKLRARLKDLERAQVVRELCAGRPHPLMGDRAGQFTVDLEGGKRLVFKPANNPVPVTVDGSIDWSLVSKVCIVFIGDYHD